METFDCGLWIVDCGLWIVDCGLCSEANRLASRVLKLKVVKK